MSDILLSKHDAAFMKALASLPTVPGEPLPASHHTAKESPFPTPPLVAAGSVIKPTPPLPSAEANKSHPLLPAATLSFPRPASWWVYADTRIYDKIYGTEKDAYEMSNTEVVGWIRVADDKPWTPVVANLAGICPCFLRHGGVCRSPRHRGVCDSTPKAGEACFKSKNSCRCRKVHLQVTCGDYHDDGVCNNKDCKQGHDISGKTLRTGKSDEHAHHHPGF